MTALAPSRPLAAVPIVESAVRPWRPPSTDITPAIRMREELARERREGKTFDEVWQRCIIRVTRELQNTPPERERQSWVNLFSEQRSVWKAAFERREVPNILGLLDPEAD